MGLALASLKVALLLGLVFAAAVWLLNCSYRNRAFDVAPSTDHRYELLSVQVDDYGDFWDPAHAQQVLDIVDAESAGRNTVVLLFVHGWHHNARAKDGNLEDFRQTLGALRALLESDSFVTSREVLTCQKEVRVLGIYVGWRGRSLPGPLDFFTVWGRKSTAERVGSGDLREFLARLQGIYRKRYESGADTFMGLVTVGHSLGAQVLFRAIAPGLEEELISRSPRLSADAPDAPTAPAAPAARAPFGSVLRGIGDITVLINPALEAHQFERLHQLTRQFSFGSAQTPTLLVISGKDDTARQCAFPLARWIGQLGRPTPRKEQKALLSAALGEYEPQRTHLLEKSSAPPTLTEASYLDPEKVRATNFADSVVFGNAKLEPVAGDKQPFRPILVAYTSGELIKKHSGIFGSTFREFLTTYVALVEGKRMLLRGVPKCEPGSEKPNP